MIKLLKIIIPSILIGLFIYFYLYFGENGKLPPLINDLPNIVIIATTSIFIGFCLFYFNQLLYKINQLKEKSLLQISAGILLCYLLLIVLFIILLRFYAFAYTSGTYSEFHDAHVQSILRFYILSFVIIFFFVLIDFTINSYQKFEQAKVLSAQLLREQSELQLNVFKQQLSPHFLFNNLNTLSHLIHENPIISEKYIRNLSRTYDYIIKNSKKDLVFLEEELDFINAYSYLLNIRYQDSLQVAVNITATKKNYSLPPLSLQLLVENAVKHNAADPAETLKIEINQSGDFIEVKNNLLKKPGHILSLKTGLTNLKKRYSFFTNKLIKISENKYFTVKIPLIKTYDSK